MSNVLDKCCYALYYIKPAERESNKIVIKLLSLQLISKMHTAFNFSPNYLANFYLSKMNSNKIYIIIASGVNLMKFAKSLAKTLA
jgi:hypothetical protein